MNVRDAPFRSQKINVRDAPFRLLSYLSCSLRPKNYTKISICSLQKEYYVVICKIEEYNYIFLYINTLKR